MASPFSDRATTAVAAPWCSYLLGVAASLVGTLSLSIVASSSPRRHRRHRHRQCLAFASHRDSEEVTAPFRNIATCRCVQMHDGVLTCHRRLFTIICCLDEKGLLGNGDATEDARSIRRKFSPLQRIPSQVHRLTRLAKLKKHVFDVAYMVFWVL
ncbi:hypothetical protein AAHA92_01003 [Salvia divinorum]|uniref:Uncharacterized protein n=1 Tax=Salvia divinorum TaxID=28513 RepID=A0ABD1IP98_SALDI